MVSSIKSSNAHKIIWKNNPQNPDIFTTFKLKQNYPKNFSALSITGFKFITGNVDFKLLKKGQKGKGTKEPNAQTTGAYPSFISMKHLGLLLLPPWEGC